jgi:outer membrane protein OmpA-like peptidoglycan-associated protein
VAPQQGQPIDLKGCKAGDKLILHGVNFEFDKATLTPNAKTILDNVAGEMKKYPALAVEVGGYTDSKGTSRYNERLSQRRASSVKAYLEQAGIDGSRLTAVGYGQSEPVADNGTDEGRELNRRVEIKITAGVAQAESSAGPEAKPAGSHDPGSDTPAPQ